MSVFVNNRGMKCKFNCLKCKKVENTGKSTALSDGAFVRIVGVYQLSAGFFTGTSSPMTT